MNKRKTPSENRMEAYQSTVIYIYDNVKLEGDLVERAHCYKCKEILEWGGIEGEAGWVSECCENNYIAMPSVYEITREELEDD